MNSMDSADYSCDQLAESVEPADYQTLHLLDLTGFILEPSGHLQSAANSGILEKGP